MNPYQSPENVGLSEPKIREKKHDAYYIILFFCRILNLCLLTGFLAWMVYKQDLGGMLIGFISAATLAVYMGSMSRYHFKCSLQAQLDEMKRLNKENEL